MPPCIWPASRRGFTTDAAVGDGDEAVDARRAGLGIDLDLADHDAGREGLDLVGEHRVAVERLPGRQLEQADAPVGADDLEGAVAIGDVGRRRLEPLGGEIAAALDHHVGGALQRRAADDGRGRAAGAAAARDAARVALADLDALDRHAERGDRIWAKTVSWPWPWLCVPSRATSRSGSTCTTTCSSAMPPVPCRWQERPRPRRLPAASLAARRAAKPGSSAAASAVSNSRRQSAAS